MADTWLRIVGDIHGEKNTYLHHVRDIPYTLQLGDLDDDYNHLVPLDPDHHKFLPGNCDNYDLMGQSRHSLGDFGVWEVPEFGPIFFVRGAWSMDWRAKTKFHVFKGHLLVRKKDLWDEEELSPERALDALRSYKRVRPNFVATHTCPDSVFHNVNAVGQPPATRTGTLLDAMLTCHRPKMWVFSHWHVNWDEVVDGTRFVCINALRYLDLPKDFVAGL